MGELTRFGILASKTKMLFALQPGTARDALVFFPQRTDRSYYEPNTLHGNMIQMSKIANRDYAPLNLSGDNYLQWALDTRISLKSKGLGDTIIEDNNENEKNRYRALGLMRHHLIDGLKDQYMTIENPLDRSLGRPWFEETY